MPTRAQAVLLSLIMILSVGAAPAAASLTAPTQNAGAAPAPTADLNTPVYYAANGVSIWERAGLPLRASTSNAQQTITNPALQVNYKPDGTGPVNIRKSESAVYSTGSQIDLKYESATGVDATAWNGNDTQLVIAHIEPDSNTDLSSYSLPANLDEARELLTPERANGNASFEIKNTNTVSSGSLETSFTPTESGVYAVFLATSSVGESGQFSIVDSDNLSVSGNMTVIGTDSVLVQNDEADVQAGKSQVQPGNNVDFSVNSPTGTSVNHTVVLYKEDTWTNAEFTTVVEEPISTDLTEEDFILQHSIKNVNGVAEFDGPVTVMGTTFNDQRYEDSTQAAAVVDFIVENANEELGGNDISNIETQATDTTTLYASAAGVGDASGSQTLTIKTNSSWDTGTYRWVYLGGGRDASDVYTETGTVTVTNNINQGGGNPSTGNNANDVTTPEQPSGPVSATVDIDQDGTARVQLSGGTGTTSVSVNVPGATGQVTVRELPEPPADIPAPTGQYVSGVDISAPNPREGETATVTVSVSRSRLDELTVSADDLVIQHYRNGEWETLETSASESGDEVVLSAPVTGFSPFAITTRDSQTGTTTTPSDTTDEPTTSTEPTTDEPTSSPPAPDGDGFPITWVIVVVLVVAAAAVGYYLQQNGGNGDSGL